LIDRLRSLGEQSATETALFQQRVLPGARTVLLPGTDHAVTQNRQWRGRPELVTPALREFFT
jgi:hypothetical protein